MESLAYQIGAKLALEKTASWGQFATNFSKHMLGDGGTAAMGKAFNGAKGGIGTGLNAIRKTPVVKDMMLNGGLGGAVNMFMEDGDWADKAKAGARGFGYGAVGGLALNAASGVLSSGLTAHKGINNWMQAPPKGANVGMGGRFARFATRHSPTALMLGGGLMLPTGDESPAQPMTNIPAAY